MSDTELRVLAEGRWLRLVAEGGWEWATRHTSTGAVVIVPITADGQVVLTEQYRIPLRAQVIDWPAGLAGDDPASRGEPLVEAARRELLEETGYATEELEFMTEGPSSAGLTDETYAIYLAHDVRKVAEGGGDHQESITVHLVALDEVDRWLEERRTSGAMIAPKVYAGLYFALTRRSK